MNSAVSRARVGATGAFTLAELMVTTGIIGIVALSSIYGILDANRFAALQRLKTSAKAACQERIDQALSTPYAPDALPALFTVEGSIPAPNGSPDRGTATIIEDPISDPIDPSKPNPLYVDEEGGALVLGKRTTRVSLSDATLGLVRVWVRVDYTFRGKAYAYEMYVVRAPD